MGVLNIYTIMLEGNAMNNLLDILKKNTLYSVDQAKNEIRETNKYSERYGLSLSEADVEELVKCRKEALANSGRVEFAGGILPKLIYAFCDSPYIQKDDLPDHDIV